MLFIYISNQVQSVLSGPSGNGSEDLGLFGLNLTLYSVPTSAAHFCACTVLYCGSFSLRSALLFPPLSSQILFFLMACQYQQSMVGSTAIQVLLLKTHTLAPSPEMGSVSQSMVLITPRVWVQSFYGPFTSELDSVILLCTLQLRLFCDSMCMFWKS